MSNPTSNLVPAALCAHGIDAMRRCSICREDAHAEAVELDRTREIQRWSTDTHPAAPTDWAAVAEFAAKRRHFTEDEWARIAQVAADGNAVAKASALLFETVEPAEGQVWECRDQVGRTGEQVCVAGIDAGDEDTAVIFVVSKAAKGYEAELGSGGSMETSEFAQRYRFVPGATAVKWWN